MYSITWFVGGAFNPFFNDLINHSLPKSLYLPCSGNGKMYRDLISTFYLIFSMTQSFCLKVAFVSFFLFLWFTFPFLVVFLFCCILFFVFSGFDACFSLWFSAVSCVTFHAYLLLLLLLFSIFLSITSFVFPSSLFFSTFFPVSFHFSRFPAFISYHPLPCFPPLFPPPPLSPTFHLSFPMLHFHRSLPYVDLSHLRLLGCRSFPADWTTHRNLSRVKKNGGDAS